MLTFIQSKNKNEQTIDYIFMTELSRFSRSENMSHCYKIIDEIYNAGVMIVTRE
jgi:DNA invertase Pin-like site-specific DNA recombinase